MPLGYGRAKEAARLGRAAAITASTRSIARTLSQSTGTVRVWRLGKLVTVIEKAPRVPTETAPPRLPEPAG